MNEIQTWEYLLNSISDCAYLIDREGYVVAANRTWLDVLGMNEQFVRGRHLAAVLGDYLFSNVCGIKRQNAPLPRYQSGEVPALQALKLCTAISIRSEREDYCTVAYPIQNDAGEVTHVFTLEFGLPEPYVAQSGPQVGRSAPGEPMVGKSQVMSSLRKLLQKVAPADTSLIITGETGVGKEVIAREIHELSSRRESPFIGINCAAIPETLLESELFGHESGAFTGAAKGGKAGLFELANHGTILLDEIGEMPVSMQPKLLRAIQEQGFYHVGGSKFIPLDVRILAATNRDLNEMVAQKQFRADLYYRLNIITVHIPPLRERAGDIGLLAETFLREFCEKHQKVKEFGPQAEEIMQGYAWPGNVRELRNFVERLVILGEGTRITAGDIRRLLTNTASSLDGKDTPTLKSGTEQYQCSLIKAALARYGSTYKAAVALGTSQTTLSRKARQFGIEI